MGVMKIESKGTLTFTDKANQLIGTVVLGKIKKRPSDYFEGTIKRLDNIVSKVYGSYMSYIEFDGERYWDYRVSLPLELKLKKNPPKSDSSNRPDL